MLSQVLIAMAAFIIIGTLMHFEVKGAYVIGLIFGSLCAWILENTWPRQFFAFAGVSAHVNLYAIGSPEAWTMALNLFTIAAIKLVGLSNSLAEMAGIAKASSGNAPRSRWLYVCCGLATIFSGAFGAGPILLSVESAAGILVGARTGLSACFCGCLFLLSYVLYPMWAAVPNAGTGPVLLMVGMLLFHNTGKVDWNSTMEALPVFITAIFSAFTCSVLYGAAFGLSTYLLMMLLTGEMYGHMKVTFRKLFYPLSAEEEVEELISARRRRMVTMLSYQAIRTAADDEADDEESRPNWRV